MSRALRYSPPVTEHGLITRPRLLEHLQRRFDRAVTLIVAAPGFGKTTLLAQAIAENALAPLGEDHWLTCQSDDASLSFLASAVYAAVGLHSVVPDDPATAAAAVAEAIWSAAPRHIALVLDDAHLIESGSAGASFLARLIQELPKNGHLVLASRPPVPLRVSRLLASGDAFILGENDMQFVDKEVDAFAAARGVPVETLDDVGGWPALAELTATVGQHAVEGYVWEELLSQLPQERQVALGLLVAVGGADDELAAEIFGGAVDLGELLSGLPLVVRAQGGWRSLHGLWGSALHHKLPAGRVAEARRVAGLVLARRRQYHDAMDLLLTARAWPEVKRLIVEVCEVCTPLVSPDVLEVWLRRLPDDLRLAPEGLLLTAMVAEPSSPAGATRILEQALADAEDDAGVQYACLNALVQLAFWRSDRRTMQKLARQLSELGDGGHVDAPGWVAVLGALLAPDADGVRAALAAPSLLTGAALNPIQDWLLAHVVLTKLGEPEAVDALARRSLAHDVLTMQAVSRALLVESLRMRGRLDDVRQLLPDILGDLNPEKVLTSPELLPYVVVILSVLGRHDDAAQLLHRYLPTVRSSPVAWALISAAVASAFHHVSVGDEDAAAADLRAVLHLGVVNNQAVVQVSASALPLLYVLIPEARATWDASAPPGHFADLLALARAVVDLRENAALTAVRALSRNARHVARSCLPPSWTTELAVALVATGDEDGRTLLEDLGQPARAVLRRRAESTGSPIAATSRLLLRQVAAMPSFRLQLQTLGTLELRRDGQLVNASELRRERVRQLLAYLLTHDRPTRGAITTELWPDLGDTAAGRNLRVTLAYLQSVFEPDRTDLDPPYFVRSLGSALQITVDEALTVDSQVFESSLDEAAQLERKGAPSAALAGYERALDAWHGDYFADLPAGDWLAWERDRLRGRFVSAALRAGNLVLARGDWDHARTLAERAVAADVWSENAYQLLVSAHLSAGDLDGAQRGLQRCRQMLRELGVPPDGRTTALAEQLRARR